MLDVRNVYLTVFLQKKTGRMEQHWQKVRKRIYWEMVTDTKTFLFVFIVSMIARARYELLDKERGRIRPQIGPLGFFMEIHIKSYII